VKRRNRNRGLQRLEVQDRSPRLYFIATEDTYAPQQYFDSFRIPQLKFIWLETTDGYSAPQHVLTRLSDALDEGSRFDPESGDECWLLLDVDRWTRSNNISTFSDVITVAMQKGYLYAISNPSFEIWLLLHLRELKDSDFATLKTCKRVRKEIVALVGQYCKTNIGDSYADLKNVRLAYERSKAMDTGDRWPQATGTQIYKLIDSLGVIDV